MKQSQKHSGIDSELPTIGIVELVSIGKRAVDVPAKIDTGADGSSIWASNVRVGKDGILRFSLFGEGSKYYNGKLFKRKDFSAVRVKNSTGHMQLRYTVSLPVKIAGKTIRARFSLADRSNNTFKILIGRRTISKKFLVDVSKGKKNFLPPTKKGLNLHEKLQKNPYHFHKKYVKPKTEGK